MKTMLKPTLALVTFLAAAGVLTSPANAQNSPVVMRITGGSIGKFIDTPHSLTTSGFTDFAANIKIYQDGTASGEFTCAIPTVVVLAVQATNATVNPDGSVRITGTEYGYDAIGGAGYNDCPATVVFRPGGPGVGGFDFVDCVFPEGLFDTERVLVGSIDITQY